MDATLGRDRGYRGSGGLGMEGYGSGTHSAGARVCECGAYTVRSRREEPESKIGKVKQVHASKLQI